MESWNRTPTTTFRQYPEVFAVLNEQEDKQAAFSEWVEQEGRHWQDRTIARSAALFATGSYFAISVAAAGWHTGALVLVDDEMAEKTKQTYIVSDKDQEPALHVPGAWEDNAVGKAKEEYVWEKMPFPRIRLPDGYEFPGEGGLREWKDGMPSVEELELAVQQGD